MPVSEFGLIQRYFHTAATVENDGWLKCGIGDDCAVLAIPAAEELLISVDTLVEKIHFPQDYSPALLARRALAVCASDLAASGATPLAFTLALTLPEVDENWLAGFSSSLASAAKEFDIVLVGGDTTRGPLCITLQVMGSAPAGVAILRSGAMLGDSIYVSGTLGDARAALNYLAKADADLSEQESTLLTRYHRPTPRLELGQALRGIATAAIDISDGLAADLGHILTRSGVAAQVHTHKLPLSAALQQCCPEQAVQYALSGGDDYELCFTAPTAQRQAIADIARQCNIVLTEIGHIKTGSSLACLDVNGEVLQVNAGYQHF